MLNGISPVLVFTFYKDYSANESAEFADGKITLPKGSNTIRTVATSIPIYLHSTLFKTVWKSHDISINIGTKSVADELFQQPYNSNLTIEFEYNRNDGVLSKLIPLLDLCYQKIANRDYSISYFNADIFVLKSKLTDVKQSSTAGQDLSTLTITLSKEIKDEEKKEKKFVGFVGKVTGTVPA